jgi:hypothetical protein
VLSAIQNNLADALARLRVTAPEAIIVVVDLYNPYSGTGDLREAIAELGVGQANGVISAVTADPNLRVKTVAIGQLFSGRGGQWVAPDGIHPNDNGHAVIAEAVLAAVDSREPAIPDDLLSVSPGATAPAMDTSAEEDASTDGDGVPTGCSRARSPWLSWPGSWSAALTSLPGAAVGKRTLGRPWHWAGQASACSPGPLPGSRADCAL